jgi:DNA-binding transcriptional MerR regulator
MPRIRFKQEKRYYSIKEVADLLGVNPSLLRYWEKQFPTIRPEKNDKGTRQYTPDMVEEIRLVHTLVKERGMTLAGAKQKLRENHGQVLRTRELLDRLQALRAELVALRVALDGIPEGGAGS